MPPKSPPPPPPPPRVSEVQDGNPQGTVTSDATDTPPRRPNAKGERIAADLNAKPSGAARTRPPTKPKLQRRLEEFFAAPAAVYAAVGHQYPAQILTLRSPQLAEDLYLLAEESPPVKRVLTKMLEGGAWGGVIVSAASILIPILSYHGVVPIGDPFQVIMPAPEADARRPIVPPPPAAAPTSSPGSANGAGRDDYTPPVAPGQPPGTVTVAGTQAGHLPGQ